MIYEAEFESNFGRIRALWEGGAYVYLYPHSGEDAMEILDFWDYENNKPVIEPTAKALANRVREWLWEMDRGIEFSRITVREIEEISDVYEAGE